MEKNKTLPIETTVKQIETKKMLEMRGNAHRLMKQFAKRRKMTMKNYIEFLLLQDDEIFIKEQKKKGNA